MINGITSDEEKIIKSVLQEFPYDFYYYGSRIKGNFTKSSVLDILLKSEEEVPYSVIDNIEMKFNESKIPYIVNISQYANMDKSFYNLIKKGFNEGLIKI